MRDIYKYSFILDLENKYKNKFEFNNSKNITLMPPIIKKIGLFYYLAFPVVPDNNNEVKKITRPIGILILNKHKKEKCFDMAKYDFNTNQNSFEKTYYVIDDKSPFWPNRTKENEEFYKVLLDLIQNIYFSTSILKKPKKVFYDNYIEKLKTFLPKEYWIFYEELRLNKLKIITEEIKNKRKNSEKIFKLERKKIEEDLKKQTKKLKEKFKNSLLKNISSFIKKEIVPSLKGNGSYTKLLFYTEIGKYIKNIDFSKFENCYNPLLTKESLNQNTNQALEDIKFDILKIIPKVCKNILCKNIPVDTISKVLIVFLNSMLIEEIKNNAIDLFEDQIDECITIFKEDIDKIKNLEAKKFLNNTFENLCNDYYIVEKDKLSNIFYGYLFVHNKK